MLLLKAKKGRKLSFNKFKAWRHSKRKLGRFGLSRLPDLRTCLLNFVRPSVSSDEIKFGADFKSSLFVDQFFKTNIKLMPGEKREGSRNSKTVFGSGVEGGWGGGVRIGGGVGASPPWTHYQGIARAPVGG